MNKSSIKYTKMSCHTEFNFDGYNIINSKTILKNICVCCLTKTKPLVSLLNCKHTYLFENILKYKIDHNMLICVLCHQIVNKFEMFKKKVEHSFAILSNQLDVKTNHFKINLQRSNLELTWTVNSLPIEFEITTVEQPTEPTNPERELTMKSEIKIERDDSDFETDIPLAQIKKAKKKVKKIKEKKITAKRMPLQKKYESVMRTVVLSMEEMVLERTEEARKDAYLKLPFKCEDCILGFDHELTLKEHIQSRHQMKKNGLECDICRSVLGSKTSFDEHKKRHFRRYECVQCCKRYNHIYSLLKHYNELHGRIDTQFCCDLCDFVTESHRSYRYHKDKHRKVKVECNECGSTFVNKAGLRVHMFTIHGQSSRVYACDVCGKRYRARSGLAAHAAAHRPAPNAYCAACNEHFRSPHGLKQHLRAHSAHVRPNDLKFKCGECGAGFLTRTLLREHVDWVHLNRTKHECDTCAKIFKNASSLKKHVDYVHEKKRPPRNKICDHCGRGFTTLSILQSHIRTHTGERPLKCTECPASFAHSAARYTHARLLHARQKLPQ